MLLELLLYSTIITSVIKILSCLRQDIAVLTNDISRCKMYQSESENVKARWACKVAREYLKKMNWRNYKIPNNREDCEVTNDVFGIDSSLVWTGCCCCCCCLFLGCLTCFSHFFLKAKNFTWEKTPSHGIPVPECRESDWSRDNHLGNGKGGYTNKYNWTLPDLDHENCVLRIRYCTIELSIFPIYNSNT